MIQVQDWDFPKGYKRILITDEVRHASVQIEVLPDDAARKRFGGAETYIYALWVNDGFRQRGYGKEILQRAEDAIRKLGYKSAAINWDLRESPRWVRSWYIRQGYDEKEFGRDCALLVKDLSEPAKR